MTGTNGTIRRGGKGVAAQRAAGAPAPGPVPLEAWDHPRTGHEARVYVGDCREVLPRVPECAAGAVDLVFADPPFNWNRAYDKWHDAMPREDYLKFTGEWLDACTRALRPGGAFWVNIPDDTAAEIVVHLKAAGLEMENWCVWHYRFGQNTADRFINSKVHALYFLKPGGQRTWNPREILEPSDRATVYFDPRTMSKNDGMPAGQRVPMDVWYGKYWGRVQGNNKERRANHDNQLPEVYLERVIRACSNPGDLVIDPFLGSGTTGLMAHALGRRFVGVEYSKDNALSACRRMKDGPVRTLGTGLNQSTAIHRPRRRGPRGAAGPGE
ncbi:MAG TPA: DNA methyltransferase [Phycisphaerales bacterium]|nr:DNA methyltransferase [Phycisphaerales bacterium]